MSGGGDFSFEPGATGWITSENMQDYLDENGQFRIPEGVTVIGEEEDEDVNHETLGRGAGRTRTAQEAVDGVSTHGEDVERGSRAN